MHADSCQLCYAYVHYRVSAYSMLMLFVCLGIYRSEYFFCCVDNEQKIIEQYFHLGYKYEVIIQLLKNEHDIDMNLRTLKRRLENYEKYKYCEGEVG